MHVSYNLLPLRKGSLLGLIGRSAYTCMYMSMYIYTYIYTYIKSRVYIYVYVYACVLYL